MSLSPLAVSPAGPVPGQQGLHLFTHVAAVCELQTRVRLLRADRFFGVGKLWWFRRRSRSPRLEGPQPTTRPADEIQERELLRIDSREALDEARWLHDYHLKRGDSAQQRAVALLGFAGVLIALIPVIGRRAASGWQTGLLQTGLAFIGISVVLAVVALLPLRSRAIPIGELSEQVEALAKEAGTSGVGLQALQSAINLTLYQPIGAKKEAPRRSPKAPKRKKSVVQAEADLADIRVRCLSASVAVIAIGVLLVLASVWNSMGTVSQAPATEPPRRPLTVPTPSPSWHSKPPPAPAPSPRPSGPTPEQTR